jgi:hypothetical protein
LDQFFEAQCQRACHIETALYTRLEPGGTKGFAMKQFKGSCQVQTETWAQMHVANVSNNHTCISMEHKKHPTVAELFKAFEGGCRYMWRQGDNRSS